MEACCEGTQSEVGNEDRPKSILKHKQTQEKIEVKWDEMNILETYHPANKDYGHMKINEPPTPYSNLECSDSDGELDSKDDSVDPLSLTESLQKASPRKHVHAESDKEDEDDEDVSEEDKVKKKEFKQKRSHHYDEFSKVKLARELIAKELQELDKDEDDVPEVQKMDTSDSSAT
eukprot:gene16843-18542_t